MKILYMVYFDLNDERMAGVKKKILAQINAMQKLGIIVDLASRVDDVYIIKNEVNKKEVSYKIKKSLTRYKNSIYETLKQNEFKNKYDYFYIRFPNTIDFSILNLFHYLGKKKVILEIPTYPIVGEYKLELAILRQKKNYLEFLIKSIVFFIHGILTKYIRYYIDTIVTYMPFEKIWNVKTIMIDNGVDTSKFSMIEKKVKMNSNDIILTGVANVSKWHGYDRILYGLNEYYNSDKKHKKNITFYIVGTGNESETLEALVDELELNMHVKFVGPKYGEELKRIYEITDIAISSLALYRIGLSSASTIKTKEYCSLGIPFVYGYEEKELEDNFPYALKIPNNHSPVSISDLINFHDNLDKDKAAYNMNKFAKERYDWVVQMNKVIDTLKAKELSK